MTPKIGRSGRAGMALACGAACCLSMLVAVGAVSAGAAIVGTTTAAALGAIAVVALLVVRRRAPEISERATLRVFAVGGALAAAGLLLSGRDAARSGATLLVMGVGVLSCLALLRLAAAHPRRAPVS